MCCVCGVSLKEKDSDFLLVRGSMCVNDREKDREGEREKECARVCVCVCERDL